MNCNESDVQLEKAKGTDKSLNINLSIHNYTYIS